MDLPWERARVAIVAAAVSGWSVGCGPMIELEEGSESGDADSTTTDPTPPPNTTAMPPGTTTAPGTTGIPQPGDTTIEPDDTGVIFLIEPEVSLPGYPCDLFAQDCPEGEKCTSWANDGGSSWNATRCSPVIDEPDAVGEPCTVEGSAVSGIDSCDYGSICWDVDPETLEGTCVAFCGGDAANPTCEDENASCTINGDGTLALCLLGCDPVLQDCDEGEACYPASGQFSCFPDDSGDMGSAGDPCDQVAGCDPGLLCAQAELVPDCAALGCCTHFCSLSDDMAPCLPGQVCTPWFEEGAAPPGYEDLGACALPAT